MARTPERIGQRQTVGAARNRAPAIAVFYPGNSLMHQVSGWAVKFPAYDFALSFEELALEVQAVLEDSTLSIFDATDNPARALIALNQAIAEGGPDSAVVYTESMYEDLELFVRSRGALFLLGPMDDAVWLELFDKRTRRRKARRAA